MNSKFPQGVQTKKMRTIYSEHNSKYILEICIYKQDDMTNSTELNTSPLALPHKAPPQEGLASNVNILV